MRVPTSSASGSSPSPAKSGSLVLIAVRATFVTEWRTTPASLLSSSANTSSTQGIGGKGRLPRASSTSAGGREVMGAMKQDSAAAYSLAAASLRDRHRPAQPLGEALRTVDVAGQGPGDGAEQRRLAGAVAALDQSQRPVDLEEEIGVGVAGVAVAPEAAKAVRAQRPHGAAFARGRTQGRPWGEEQAAARRDSWPALRRPPWPCFLPICRGCGDTTRTGSVPAAKAGGRSLRHRGERCGH